MLEAVNHPPSGGVHTSPAGRQTELHRGEQAPLAKVMGIPYERRRAFLASSITDRADSTYPSWRYTILYTHAREAGSSGSERTGGVDFLPPWDRSTLIGLPYCRYYLTKIMYFCSHNNLTKHIINHVLCRTLSR